MHGGGRLARAALLVAEDDDMRLARGRTRRRQLTVTPAGPRWRCRGTRRRPWAGPASALVSALTPMPSSKAAFGQMLSTTTTPRLQPVEQPGMEHDRACAVAEPRPAALGDAEAARNRSGWISTVGRPLAGARARRLGEGGVQELARRGGHQAEGMLARRRRRSARPVIGQRRHLGMVDAQALPVRLEAELAVGMAEAVEEMRRPRKAARNRASGR